jgi:acyl-CoA thioester hydrolase
MRARRHGPAILRARLRRVSRPEPSRQRFVTRVRVRYADTDASGTVHHATYLAFFETARVEALRGLGVPIAELVARGVAMPVFEARLRLRRPALLDDLLDVAVLLDRVGPASFSFDYEVTRDGELLATGWTRMAVVEASTGRALRLPAWVRELLDSIAH